MSTRSIIARPEGDSWRGRYVHSDGYPTGVLDKLAKLIARDGYDVATRTLLDDNYGWSALYDTQPARLPAGHPYGKDKRFRAVKGDGVAYTDTVVDMGPGQRDYQQTTAEEWGTPENDMDADWVYVVTPGAVTVLVPQMFGEGFRRVASVTWSSLNADRLSKIERMGEGS